MKKIEVWARLPSNAHHLHIPEGTEWEHISSHRWTERGRRNAIRSALKTSAEYARSHGNAASHGIQFRRGELTYSPRFLDVLTADALHDRMGGAQ